MAEELFKQVGLKVQPVDIARQEQFMEIEKRKALQTLLGERGVITKFEIPFVPKPKPQLSEKLQGLLERMKK